MKSYRRIAAACLVFAAALPAQTVTLAYESFNYPPGTGVGGQSGGSGWFNTWYSGGSGSDAIVTAPGFDGTGNKLTTAVSNAGSYRIPLATPVPPFSTGGLFGVDNSTLWISFQVRRTPGGDDNYGGLSLFHQFVGEKLFMGSPYLACAWGFQTYGPTGQTLTVAGTNCDTLATLVYRIDFLPGSERLRLWVDPADPHPLTTAALDVFSDNFVFNEIRLQSGNGTVTGFDFDAVHLEWRYGSFVGDPETISVATGGTQTMALSAGAAYGGLYYLAAGTLSGTSPGIQVGSINIPLNYDFWTDFTIYFYNTPPLANNFSILDPSGNSLVSLTLPPLPPAFAGVFAHHAAVVLDAGGAITLATNATPVLLVP